MTNLIHESVFSSKYNQEQKKERKSHARTEKEIFEEVFMKPHNRLRANGRINAGYEPDGRVRAVSVSPRMPEFETQVEPLIYPTVKALVDKGYMTISSCQGHPKRTHIKLGFGNKESRSEFIEIMKKSKIPTMYFIETEACINMEMDLDETKDNKKVRRADFEEVSEQIILMNARNFNMQFKKNYEQWFFLDMNLFQHDTINPINYLYVMSNLIRKNKIIERLTTAINSDDLPAYNRLYASNEKKRRLKDWNKNNQ